MWTEVRGRPSSVPVRYGALGLVIRRKRCTDAVAAFRVALIAVGNRVAPVSPAQIRTGALAHTAPPSDADGKPLSRPRVTDMRAGPVKVDQSVQSSPRGPILLGAAPLGSQEQLPETLLEAWRSGPGASPASPPAPRARCAPGPGLQCHHAELYTLPAERVEHLGTLLDQQAPCPVQRQHRLHVHLLARREPHPRPLHRLGDRLCIGRVVHV